MTPLFGLVFAVLATVLCWAAVTVTRAARGWRDARGARLRADGDTVEIVRRPGLRRVAQYAALVVLALPAGVLAGGGALPGPSGGFGGGLPTTGGTMTGQVVFDGPTIDISTGASNQNLTIVPDGTGMLDLRAPMTNGGATTCNGMFAGASCVTALYHMNYYNVVGGTGYVAQNTNVAGVALFSLMDNASVSVGGLGYANASYSDADVAGKVYLNGGSKKIAVIATSDIAAGTDILEVLDNATATGVRQFSVDGNGAVKFRVMTSAHGSTCNSANEGLHYYRVIDASNKSGLCTCARTATGTYGWKAGTTFGSTPLADGDC